MVKHRKRKYKGKLSVVRITMRGTGKSKNFEVWVLFYVGVLRKMGCKFPVVCGID